MNFLSGYRTYIVGAAIVLTAIGGFVSNELTLMQAVVTVLEGLGLGALRAGVAKP